MIVQVWRRAMEAGIGPVVVAADDTRIADAITQAGGRAVLTAAHHPSGTDRIAEALALIDPHREHETVLNVQGDLPTVASRVLHLTASLLDDGDVDIATSIAPIHDPSEAARPSVVKFVGTQIAPGRHRALYFTRAQAPWGAGPLYHHIGLYAWRRTALERFVALPPSPLEQREKLEQLRALEAGMRIDAIEVDDVPLGVDTQDDLIQARRMLGD